MPDDLDKERDYSPGALKERERQRQLDDEGAEPTTAGEQAALDQMEAGYGQTAPDRDYANNTGQEPAEDDEQPGGENTIPFRKEKGGMARGAINKWVGAQKAGIYASLAGFLVLGFMGILAFISGPAGIVAFGRLLEQFHFTSHSAFVDTSVGRMIRYARTVETGQEKRNMGYFGNAVANYYSDVFALSGVTLDYNGASRQAAYIIDTKNPRGAAAADTLSAMDLELVDRGNGILFVNVEGMSARSRRQFVGATVDAIGLKGIHAAIGKRAMRVRAGVGFHPLKNLARAGDEALLPYYRRFHEAREQRIKNGIDATTRTSVSQQEVLDENGEPIENPRGPEITGEAEGAAKEVTDEIASTGDVDAAASKLRSRMTRGAGAFGAASLICGMQKLGDAIGDMKYVNVILPLMRLGMEAVTTSSQTASNQAFNMDELGAMNDMLYDEETGTSAFAAANIQRNLGQTVTGPEIPESARPDTGKPRFFRTIDSVIGAVPGGNTVCDAVTSTAGGWAIDIASWLSQSGGPVTFLVNAVTDYAVGYAAGYLIEDMVRWMASKQVDSLEQGAVYGAQADAGVYLTANDDAISAGGTELSPLAAVELQADNQEYLQREQQSQSLFARVFDPANPNSLFARTFVMQPQFASANATLHSAVYNPASFLSPLMGSIGNLFMNNRVSAAASAENYGVPRYGHALSLIEDPEFENPYRVEQMAEEIGIDTLNEKYGRPCFGTTVDPTSYAIRFEGAMRYDELEERTQCRDGSYELRLSSMYYAYMKTFKTMACSGAIAEIEDASCTELGYGQAPTAGGPTNNLQLITGDTSNIPCAAGTDEGVQTGYQKGAPVQIRICTVAGGFDVNSQISGNVQSMVETAAAAGVNMSGDSFRSMSEQQGLYAAVGSGTAATPGNSRHQMGFALDINCDGELIPRRVAPGTNRCYDWLVANAGRYGLIEYGKGNRSAKYEAWHWSVDGN